MHFSWMIAVSADLFVKYVMFQLQQLTINFEADISEIKLQTVTLDLELDWCIVTLSVCMSADK